MPVQDLGDLHRRSRFFFVPSIFLLMICFAVFMSMFCSPNPCKVSERVKTEFQTPFKKGVTLPSVTVSEAIIETTPVQIKGSDSQEMHVMYHLRKLNQLLPKALEGGSFVSALSIDFLSFIAQMKSVRTYCESGFNAGHSSLVILASNSNSMVISIDKMVHSYSKVAKQYIDSTFPGRHILVRDDVLQALGSWTMSKCDFIFSDAHFKPFVTREAELWMDKGHNHTLFMYESRAIYAPNSACRMQEGANNQYRRLIQQGNMKPVMYMTSNLMTPWASFFGYKPFETGIWIYSLGHGDPGVKMFPARKYGRVTEFPTAGCALAQTAQAAENVISNETVPGTFVTTETRSKGNPFQKCQRLIKLEDDKDMFCMRLKSGAIAVTFNPKTDHIAKIAKANGNYLFSIQKIFYREIQLKVGARSLLMLDIGANVGMFTLMAAGYGHKVISFEPFSRNFRRLALARTANRFENSVTLYNFALGSRDSEAYVVTQNASKIFQTNGVLVSDLSDPALTEMMSDPALKKQGLKQADAHFERIRTRTLDGLFHAGNLSVTREDDAKVQVVKIDVEGFESLVVSGGQSFFQTVRPALIFMEMHPGMWDSRQQMGGWQSRSEVVSFFRKLGYCARYEDDYANSASAPCFEENEPRKRDVVFKLEHLSLK